MSLGHREHQDVTGGGSLSVLFRRYPCARPEGATPAPVGMRP
jgi:hypothetical protein